MLYNMSTFFEYMYHYCTAEMWNTAFNRIFEQIGQSKKCKPSSDCSFRSSLIRMYTFCHSITKFLHTPPCCSKWRCSNFLTSMLESWCQKKYRKYVKFFAALSKKCWLNVGVFHFSTRMPKMDALTYRVEPKLNPAMYLRIWHLVRVFFLCQDKPILYRQFGLILNFPVNSYGHVRMVSSP